MVMVVSLEELEEPHAPSMPTVISVATTAVPAFFQVENLLISNPFLSTIHQAALLGEVLKDSDFPTRVVGISPSLMHKVIKPVRELSNRFEKYPPLLAFLSVSRQWFDLLKTLIFQSFTLTDASV